MSLDDFCARPHALVSFAGDLSGFIDEHTEKLDRKRHVVLAVPQFNGLATLLTGTDIIATVPDYAAQVLTAAGGVRSEDLPIETRTFELHMAGAARRIMTRGALVEVADSDVFGDPDSL